MCELCNVSATCLFEFLPNWHLGVFEKDSEHFSKGEFYISRTESNEIASAFDVRPVNKGHKEFDRISYEIHESIYLRPVEGANLVGECVKAGWNSDDELLCDFLCDLLATKLDEFELKHGVIVE